VVTDPRAGWAGLDELIQLTERALAVGLDEAVAAARAALAAALGEGVDDPEVERAIGIAVASAERALAARDVANADVDALRSMAHLDELTGLPNRRAFFARVDDELLRAQRGLTTVTLVLCDLDQLKAINDARGHPAGDAALRAFGELLAANVRASDCVGRLGGDEFGVLLVGADATGADHLLKRLCESEVDDVRASFGVARVPDDGRTRDELVAAADRRLYEQKQARRSS
jgi:diguanylate cyclase (GGDEF)-like protein